MKLLRAEFQNFRLLRNLELEFASDPNKNLTVIRAANDSGKTTILHALQWALYGDSALPGKGEGFRLYPIDWDLDEGKRVPITATVEFEMTTYRRVSGKMREKRHRYRLVRSAFEEINGKTGRTDSTVKLFALTDKGATPIDSPGSLINEEFPPELREVFFTDGDRALSFIEADIALSTKRDRVQRAIRSLLGLGVIGDAIKHVRKSAMEVNKKARKIGSSSELEEVASSLERIEVNREKLETDLEDAKQQFGAFDEKVDEIDRKIAEVLQKGNREKLQKDLERARRENKRLDSQLVAAGKEHSALFRGRAIAIDLLSPVLNHAFEKLEELHDQGKIPNTTVPVLQERLAAEICICGETLEPGNKEGEKRRGHIQKLIDDSQRADEIQEIITDLYYGAKPLQAGGASGSSKWFEDYKKVVEHRDGIQILRDEGGRKLRELELQLDSLPDIDIQGLRKTRRQYNDLRDKNLKKQSVAETQLDGLSKRRDELEARRNRLLHEQEKGAQILAESEVIQDVIEVLQNAYKRITDEELHKVSELMNSTFLEMIGSDPEQGAIIRRAEISREFDIIVYGPKDRTLNPDRDLNGASRRALTLSFILALTKVSEIEAPNVIDTPLGMTSGYVKRSILRAATEESTQLILFLTHDEIAGCEDIIDEAADIVFTLTNPAHYPKMLVNNPDVAERKILRCECNHRNECQLCQRRVDAQTDTEIL